MNLIKLVVLFGILIFIYYKFKDHQIELADAAYHLQNKFSENPIILIFVVLLMPLNWSVEALKWKVLIGQLATFKQAFKGVLLGLSLSFITPHGLGDYFGRMFYLQNEERHHYIGNVLVGRICQMIPTLMFGMVGLQYVWFKEKSLFIIIVISCISVIVMLLFPLRKIVLRFLTKIKIVRQLFIGLADHSFQSILSVLTLSFVRYLIFTSQFLLLLTLFVPELDLYTLFAGVSWIFLAKSIIPTFNFLSDLGVREVSALYFFENYNVDLSLIFSASIALWLINILVPTVISTPLIFKTRGGRS